jgi:glycopeptide antibiotics resistance protein
LQRATPVLDILLYLVCAGVFYGSLFPFNFSVSGVGTALDAFLASWNRLPGRGDILGNIFLFIPFGVFSGLLVRRGRRSVAWVIGVWLLVALGAQVLQLFLPSRDPAIFDLYTNAAGALAGYLAARLLPADMVRVDGVRYGGDYVPLCLAALWLAWELLPFIPSIDLQAYKAALKPLFVTPRFAWYESLLQATGWFVALYMLERVAGARLRPAHVLGVFALVLALKVAIVMNSIAVTDVVAMAVAFLAWLTVGRASLNGVALAVFTMLVWCLDAVSPLAFRGSAEGFNWVPFSGFLEGSMLVNVIALCRKGFFFGAIVWLLLREFLHQRQRYVPAVLTAAGVLLVLEIVQMFLYAGHPEVTDPLLFLAIAWLLRHVDSAQATAAARAPAPAPRIAGVKPAMRSTRRNLVLILGAYALLACIALKLLLGLPGIPYNVVELFRFGGNGVDLFFFSLAMLSIGIGGAWFGKVLYQSGRPVRATLGGFFAVGLVTFCLLWLGVSQESIRDIAGSTVFVHRVMERGVLGEPGIRLFELLGPQNVHVVTMVVEPVIRFTALVAPLFIFLGVCALRLWRNVGIVPAAVSRPHVAWSAVVLLALLFAAKVIAFDWSSTDNLNELIARDGDWGLGGGGYLYLLVFTLSAVAMYLAESAFTSPPRLPRGLLALVFSLPLTWWLLNSGLEENVQKYDRTFSGVDFLLGPDRDNLVTTGELFLRWGFVHTIAVAGLAFGAAMCVAWFRAGAGAGPVRKEERVDEEFRVYADQAEFLQRQLASGRGAVDEQVNHILGYFSAEFAQSPGSVDIVRQYLSRSAQGQGRVFARQALQVQLAPASLDVLALVDPRGDHSRSRCFRKLLDIYIEAQGSNAVEGARVGAPS